jgi:peptide/nickel transport system substrate-binding protein
MARTGRLVAQLAGAVAAAALLAPVPAAAQKVLKVVPQADVRVLDPFVNNSGITTEFAYMVYDTLMAVDKDERPQPQMAESVSMSADGLTYTFVLRPGQKFSDGSPVRAADVVASLKRWAGRDIAGKRMVELGATFEAVNDRTLTLKLKEPFGLTLDTLSKTVSMPTFVMREKEANVDVNTAVTDIVGSGPYLFKKDEWVPGSKVVFTKSPTAVPRSDAPNFYSGAKLAKIDRVEWIIIPDTATASAALTQGEVDFWESPPGDLIPVLKRNRDITVAVHNKSGFMAYLRPNFLHPPFDNPKARQALLYVVNQMDYMASAIGGDPTLYKQCNAWLVCGTQYASEAGTEDFRKPNLDKAKALLKEAGYTNQKVVILQPSDFKVIRDLTEVTIQRLREIGMNIEVESIDWGQLILRRGKKEPIGQGGWSMYHTYSTGYELGPPNANFNISGACEQRSWFGWPCDPETERLRDAFAKEGDLAKRKAIAEALQKRAAEFVHYVPLGQFFSPVAYRSNLKGVMEVPWAVYWNIEKN